MTTETQPATPDGTPDATNQTTETDVASLNAAWLTGPQPAALAELEVVEGVGELRAKDIREGLRRLQEINLVDRFLQT